MYPYSLIIVLTLIINGISSFKYYDLSDIYITNFVLTKCNTRSIDPVSVEDVKIQIDSNKKIHVSGSLSTSEDLISPVKTSVTLKKKVFFGWIHIPCEKNIGSCDYNNLCSYGYPDGKECPSVFVENGVPCRCPIKRGNYTLPPTEFEITNERDVLEGKYKGNVYVSHLDRQLACYNMNFVLKER